MKQVLELDLQPSNKETTVCAMRVPSKEEVWATAKASQSDAWAVAKKVTPTLENIKDYQLPEVDWAGAYVRLHLTIRMANCKVSHASTSQSYLPHKLKS